MNSGAENFGSRQRSLARASVAVGIAGLLVAAAPLTLYGEPPIWVQWIFRTPSPVAPMDPLVGFTWDNRSSGDADRVAPTTTTQPRRNLSIGRFSITWGRAKKASAPDDGGSVHDPSDDAGAAVRGQTDSERRQSITLALRIAAACAGVLGILLACLSGCRGYDGRLARRGLLISVFALTWDFVLLGIAIAIAVFVLAHISIG